jgi:hypothetical protein
LSEELQSPVWELVKRIKPHPHGKDIEEVVNVIREAITAGWEQRIETLENGADPLSHEQSARPSPDSSPLPAGQALSANRSGPIRRHTAPRESDLLGAFFRWAARINTWDAESIALSDDKNTRERHLKAARQIRTFCETFISTLELRLSH